MQWKIGCFKLKEKHFDWGNREGEASQPQEGEEFSTSNTSERLNFSFNIKIFLYIG